MLQEKKIDLRAKRYDDDDDLLENDVSAKGKFNELWYF